MLTNGRSGAARGLVAAGLLLAGVVDCPAQLRLGASFGKEQFVSGEEMCIRVVFENAGKSTLALVRPATLDSDVLRLRIVDASGRDVSEAARREPPPDLDDVSRLAAGQKLEVAFDLHGRFLTGLAPGEYTYSVSYDCPVSKFPFKARELVEVKGESERARVKITPRSAEQEDEARRFEAAFRAPDAGTQLARCRETLEAYPQGLFARRLRMLLALGLSKTGQAEEAIAQYARVLADAGASPATQAACRLKLAVVHRERGDLEAAIEMLKQVDTRQARQLMMAWMRELESRRP